MRSKLFGRKTSKFELCATKLLQMRHPNENIITGLRKKERKKERKIEREKLNDRTKER